MVTDEKEFYQFPEEHDQELGSFVRIILTALLLLVVFAGAAIWHADRLLVHIPFPVERDFVRPYEELLLKYWTKEGQELEIQRYLQSLANALTRAMQMSEEMVIRVHYVEGDTANAFATLGGHVFVFRELIETLPDENSLAMVLAHEIAHIKHRDPIVSMGRGAVLQIAYGLLTGSGGEIFSTGSEMGMLFFSREQETKADHEAVAALYRHYGHVAGATTFFKLMLDQQKTDEEALPKWLLTHPKLDQRINAINEYIAQKGWKIGEATPKPKLMSPPG